MALLSGTFRDPAFLLSDNCSPHFDEGVTKISDENNLKLLYLPPMNIMKSFGNVGISLNRVGLQIRSAVTPDTPGLWKKEGPTEKNAVAERKNGPED
jgi:hypothetical protein